MGTYLAIAWANVRRSVRDYSVYFLTLAFATGMLYLFCAAGDYVLALDLTPAQRGVYETSGQVIQAFSVFTVLVFAFLVTYATRFMLRRRSQEFALYGLVGMPSGAVAGILACEGVLVGAGALVVGIAGGCVLTPLFGGVVAFVFDAPWRLQWLVSPGAAGWTAGCFAAVMAVSTLLSIVSLRRRTLAELLGARRAPDRPVAAGPVAATLRLVAGALLIAGVWAVCLVAPIQFVMLALPLGCAAVLGTCLVFRALANRVPAGLRRCERWYARDLHCFVVRQLEARVSSGAMAMAWVCALVAVGVCLVAAGFAFSVGLRESAEGGSRAMAPIGFVGILYGATFLVVAAAVLALQQLSEAADNAARYRVLADLGAPVSLMRRAVRSQVGACFALPCVGAALHAVFGLAVVGFLAEMLETAAFGAIVAGVAAVTAAVLGLYYLVTCAVCWRAVGFSAECP